MPLRAHDSNATASDELIVALDYPDAAKAIRCAEQLGQMVSWFKVGLELYLAGGAGVVHDLKRRGHRVFLDLKLHDIPNTVAGAVRSLGALEPDLLTVHASGGRAMLQAAADAAQALPHPPQLLAVTVLTSLDAAALAEMGISYSPAEQAMRLAELAADSGMSGMVCSAAEVSSLRAALPHALLVTPGIRPAGSVAGDQKRMATPRAALQAGASKLVIGRPITAADDPKTAAQAILEEIAG